LPVCNKTKQQNEKPFGETQTMVNYTMYQSLKALIKIVLGKNLSLRIHAYNNGPTGLPSKKSI